MGLVAPRHVDLPRPGIEPKCPALAGGFLTTVPPGKSLGLVLKKNQLMHLVLQMLVKIC